MNPSTLISAHELAAALGDPELLIVDCRHDLADPAQGEREYHQGHLPGAAHAHLDRDLSDHAKPNLGRHPLPDATAFAATLGRWGWTPRTRLIAYDAAGGAMAAARLWWMLRLADAGNATVLDGGIAVWRAANLPLATDAPTRVATSPTLHWQPDQAIYDAQLHRLREDPATLLLDARAAPRFRGEVEPIDPVAGHIPGARNRPVGDNLQADGCFKSAAALRAEFTAVLGTHAPDRVIHSCGSGVSAAANLLAMEHAGLAGSRLYAPSWSGWIGDPANPVERGAERPRAPGQ